MTFEEHLESLPIDVVPFYPTVMHLDVFRTVFFCCGYIRLKSITVQFKKLEFNIFNFINWKEVF